MATFFDSNGVNLTSFGGNRLEKNTVAITVTSDRVEVIGDGIDGETYSVTSYSIPITQLELGKDASGNYLNGCIKSFYYYPIDVPSAQLKALSTRRETKQLPPASQPNFVFTISIPIANTTWNLRSTGTVNYDVDWGDGQTEIVQTSNTKAHVYATPGNYTVVVTIRSGVFRPFFNNTTDATRITSIISTGTGWDFGTNLASAFYGGSSVVNMENISVSNVTDMSNAWRSFSSLLNFPFLDTPSVTTVAQAWTGCSSLTSFPPLNLAAVTNFSFAWDGCLSLITFPFVNTALGTNFSHAWRNCIVLSAFPLINTALGTNFNNTWRECRALTSFPLLNTGAGTNFDGAWYNCNQLVSFPSLNLSAGTTFNATWQLCSSLTTFPSGRFNTSTATNFTNAWNNCALTAQSIENILVSINTANTSNGTLHVGGGTNAIKSTWTTAANTAYDALIARGWTITFRS